MRLDRDEMIESILKHYPTIDTFFAELLVDNYLNNPELFEKIRDGDFEAERRDPPKETVLKNMSVE